MSNLVIHRPRLSIIDDMAAKKESIKLFFVFVLKKAQYSGGGEVKQRKFGL